MKVTVKLVNPTNVILSPKFLITVDNLLYSCDQNVYVLDTLANNILREILVIVKTRNLYILLRAYPDHKIGIDKTSAFLIVCCLIFQGDVWICMEVMDTSLDKFYKKIYEGGDGSSIPEKILGKIAFSVSIPRQANP